MEFIAYILAGAAVGLAVGITGVGGGSLMTPLLLMFGFPPHIAIGTDLLYAAITKSGGVVMHHRQKNICWPVVLRLLAGSLPASVITIIFLKLFFTSAETYQHLLTSSLGLMLILTALVLLFKNQLRSLKSNRPAGVEWVAGQRQWLTVVMGVLLGIFVTLSSIGAGALGTAMLVVLYPALSALRIIGSDLAHAVPLTLIAGLGHLALGNVDFLLLGTLLIGSLPAIYVGTHLARRMPERVLQPILASALFMIGIKYTFF